MTKDRKYYCMHEKEWEALSDLAKEKKPRWREEVLFFMNRRISVREVRFLDEWYYKEMGPLLNELDTLRRQIDSYTDDLMQGKFKGR